MTTRGELGRFGGKYAWRKHLERIKKELTVMRDKAVKHTDAKHAGTCYQGTIDDAAEQVDQAVYHIRSALDQLA